MSTMFLTAERRRAIAQRLDLQLASRGWSVRRLATEAGTSYHSTWNACHGCKGYGLGTLSRIETALAGTEPDPALAALVAEVA